MDDKLVASPTLLDAAAAAPTLLDSGVSPSVERRDLQASDVRIILPDALRKRFTIQRQFDAVGAQADVFLARDLANARDVVIKLYRLGVKPPTDDLLKRIVAADPRHVIALYEHGQEGGQAYEIMEYAIHGSLRDQMRGALRAEDVRPILIELVDALEHLHQQRIIFRDLKPDNILIRSLTPLDLVFADFGISSINEHKQRATNASRTLLYGAPEALSGLITAAVDWWSLGIMLVEMLGGTHPFQGLTDNVILNWLTTRPVGAEHIEDTHWQTLCRGLLLRDPEQRWGAVEIRRWLAGETIPVTDDIPLTHVASYRPYRFCGKDYATPSDLAAGLLLHWDDGAKDFKRDWITNWFRDDVKDNDLIRLAIDLQELWLSPDASLAKLVYGINPKLPPIWKGQDASLAGVLALAQAAQKDETQRAALVSLCDNLNHLPHGEVQNTARQLAEARKVYETAWASVPADVGKTCRPEWPIPLPALVLSIFSDEASARNNDELLKFDLDKARKGRWWFSSLGDPGTVSPEIKLVLLATVKHVIKEINDQDAAEERRRIEDEEDEERRRIEDEEDEERRRIEAEKAEEAKLREQELKQKAQEEKIRLRAETAVALLQEITSAPPTLDSWSITERAELQSALQEIIDGNRDVNEKKLRVRWEKYKSLEIDREKTAKTKRKLFIASIVSILGLIVYLNTLALRYSAAESFEIAFSAEKKGDHSTAVAHYENSIAKDEGAIAMNNLGTIYSNEKYSGMNMEKSTLLLKKSAKLGVEEANTNLLLNFDYFYNLKDRKEAFKWSKSIIDSIGGSKKSANAIFLLGSLYENGDGVSQDLVLAAKYYAQAAEYGDSDANIKLGFLYETGQGVPKDIQKAIELYRRSGKTLGNESALRLAAQNNDQKALTTLGQRARNLQNYPEAIKYYKSGADLGYAPAQFELAEMYENGLGVISDKNEAFRLYLKSATQKYGLAAYRLGQIYEHGNFVVRDVESGEDKAIKDDREMAIGWYQIAVNGGYIEARQNINAIQVDESNKVRQRVIEQKIKESIENTKKQESLHRVNSSLDKTQASDILLMLEKSRYLMKEYRGLSDSNAEPYVNRILVMDPSNSEAIKMKKYFQLIRSTSTCNYKPNCIKGPFEQALAMFPGNSYVTGVLNACNNQWCPQPQGNYFRPPGQQEY